MTTYTLFEIDDNGGVIDNRKAKEVKLKLNGINILKLVSKLTEINR